MKSREIDFARRHLKVPVDEVHQAVRQVRREVGAEVRGTILAQAPGHVNARIFFVRQLDIREGLVVAQQDIKTRLVLLNQVVFKG